MQQEHLHGLYFPYVHFRDESFLKQSLLYWESLGRILPASSPEMAAPSTTLQILEHELKFLDVLQPQVEVENVATSFLSLVQTFGLELVARYTVTETLPHITEIFAEDLSPGLESALIELRLAVPSPQTPGAVLVHNHLARLYMTSVAREVAARHNLHPVTDNLRDFVAIGAGSVQEMAQVLLAEENILVDEASEAVHGPRRRLAYVALETSVPRKLAKVEIETLINFRRSYARELFALRHSIQSLVDAAGRIQNLDDSDGVQKQLETLYLDGPAQHLMGLRANLLTWGVETVPGVLVAQVIVEDEAEAETHLGPSDSGEPEIISAAHGALAFSLMPIRPLAPLELSPRLTVGASAYYLPTEENAKPQLTLVGLNRLAAVLALQ